MAHLIPLNQKFLINPDEEDPNFALLNENYVTAEAYYTVLNRAEVSEYKFYGQEAESRPKNAKHTMF